MGSRCRLRRAVAATLVVVAVSSLAEFVRWGEVVVWFPFAFTTLLGTVMMCGQASRRHREQAAALRTLTRRLREERDALARLAVVEERTRMARELHDAIAHGVSVMVLQAGAVEQVLDAKPATAAQAAQAIQNTGREVLAELGRLLGLLAPQDGRADQLPAEPSLARIGELVAHVRHAGLPVDSGSRDTRPVSRRASTRRPTA